MTAEEQQQYIEARKRVKAHIDARCRELGAEKEARRKRARDPALENKTGESYVRSTAAPPGQDQAEYERLSRWLVDEQMGIHKADAKRGERKSSAGPRSTDPDPVVREYADRLAEMMVAAQKEEAAKRPASFMVQERDSRPTQRGTGTDSSALIVHLPK